MQPVDFLLGKLFDIEGEGDVSPKRQLTFTELRAVISQKMHHFIATAKKTTGSVKISTTRRNVKFLLVLNHSAG
jgi:hypothetical protein